jgi:hypothetical protein
MRKAAHALSLALHPVWMPTVALALAAAHWTRMLGHDDPRTRASGMLLGHDLPDDRRVPHHQHAY